MGGPTSKDFPKRESQYLIDLRMMLRPSQMRANIRVDWELHRLKEILATALFELQKDDDHG